MSRKKDLVEFTEDAEYALRQMFTVRADSYDISHFDRVFPNGVRRAWKLFAQLQRHREWLISNDIPVRFKTEQDPWMRLVERLTAEKLRKDPTEFYVNPRPWGPPPESA